MTSPQLPLLVLLLACYLGGVHALAEEVQEVDICEVVRSPQDYAGKFIRTSGRVLLRRLKTRERDIGSHCPAVVLVVTPDEVTPRPDFSLSEDIDSMTVNVFDGDWRRGEVFSVVIDGKIRDVPGFHFAATLEGRFDWIGVDLPPYPLKWKSQGRIDWKSLRTKTGERVSRKDLFGKIKVPMRLVLRRISDVFLQSLLPKH